MSGCRVDLFFDFDVVFGVWDFIGLSVVIGW